MPQAQSTVTRQLTASAICAVALLKQSNSPVAVAERVAAYQQQHVDRMSTLIHEWTEEYKTAPAPKASAWRDAWCHLCDTNDAYLGTLTQHASRIFDLGWKIEGGLKGNLLVCPKCQEVN